MYTSLVSRFALWVSNEYWCELGEQYVPCQAQYPAVECADDLFELDILDQLTLNCSFTCDKLDATF